MKGIRLGVVAVVSFLTLAVSAHGADWPMLGRDSSRNAVSPEKVPLFRWQTEQRDGDGALEQHAWNVLWQARLGGASFAPPVIAEGLVWVGTNNYHPRDPRVKDDFAVLMCFRASEGRFLWQYVVLARDLARP